jgi:hypothetical protein
MRTPWKPVGDCKIQLMQELKMLHVGQYFMSSFITRAASCNVELPSEVFSAEFVQMCV